MLLESRSKRLLSQFCASAGMEVRSGSVSCFRPRPRLLSRVPTLVAVQQILPQAEELCPESDVTERFTNPDKVKAKMDRLDKKIKAQEAR